MLTDLCLNTLSYILKGVFFLIITLKKNHIPKHVQRKSQKERQERRGKRVFETKMFESFPNLMNNINLHVREAQWTPSRMKITLSPTLLEIYCSTSFNCVNKISNLRWFSSKKFLFVIELLVYFCLYYVTSWGKIVFW